MAEPSTVSGSRKKPSNKDEKCLKLQEVYPEGAESSDLNTSKLECAVCLQSCVHPVQLPCNHIFCFLCVKGTANQSKKCAMCRQEIPMDFLDHPQLVNQEDLDKDIAFEDGYQWFYEGHNGWWQYDERTSYELEEAFKKGDKHCELLIAGFLYIIDFESMLQVRRNDPVRRRRIKRDLASIPKKGVAGLRVGSSAQSQNRENAEGEERDSQDSTPNAPINANLLSPNTPIGLQSDAQFLTLQVPSNTPQSPISSSDSNNTSFSETLSQEFHELHLNDEHIITLPYLRRRYENEDGWESGRSESSEEDEV